jgi:NADH:ubiquinone oxidoreductase subunit D
MFDWATFKTSRDFYSGCFGESYSFDHTHHHIQVDSRNLDRVMEILRHDMGFLLLSDIVATETKNHKHYNEKSSGTSWDITYHLFQLEAHQRFQVHLLLKQGEKLPSVLRWFSCAEKLEVEARVSLGEMQTNNAPLALPKYKTNPNLSESPYPEELNQWYLFDLNHPITRHQWELAVEAREGRVQRSWMQSGHWKRNWEKKAEGKSLHSIGSILSGLIPLASPLVNVGWSKTVEDYFLVTIPERAQAIRMVFIELSRIHHHAEVLQNIADDLELVDALQICRELKERIRFLFKFYSGSRLTLSQTHFGGLSHDLPAGWIQESINFLNSLDKMLHLYHKMVALHPVARLRLTEGALSAQDALNAGVTGPTLRAAGVNFDLRKSRPFYFYQDMKFDVPVGLNGNSYDRMLILVEECHQSLKILYQVIDNLPLGDVSISSDELVDLNNINLQTKEWKNLFEKTNRSWSAQYTAIEGPNGELAFHLVLSPETPTVHRLKIKSNAALLAQALPNILNQCNLTDLAVTLSTLNINASILDR